MERIEKVLKEIRDEISQINFILKYENPSPEEHEELMEKSQKLHRELYDIRSKFNL